MEHQPNGYSEVSGSYDTQYMRDMDELMNDFSAGRSKAEQ